MEKNPTREEKLDEYTQEIFEYMRDAVTWGNAGGEQDIREVLQRISAYRARAVQIKIGLSASKDHTINRFISMQLDPFIQEMREQFEIWSRIITKIELEWKMSRG